MTKIITRAAAALGILSATAFAAAAEDCAERGALDVLYCDANGDLVADTPTDPAELSNPDTQFMPTSGSRSSRIWKKQQARMFNSLRCSPTLPRLKLCALAVCMWRVSPPDQPHLR